MRKFSMKKERPFVQMSKGKSIVRITEALKELERKKAAQAALKSRAALGGIIKRPSRYASGALQTIINHYRISYRRIGVGGMVARMEVIEPGTAILYKKEKLYSIPWLAEIEAKARARLKPNINVVSMRKHLEKIWWEEYLKEYGKMKKEARAEK